MRTGQLENAGSRPECGGDCEFRGHWHVAKVAGWLVAALPDSTSGGRHTNDPESSGDLEQGVGVPKTVLCEGGIPSRT